MKMAKPSRMPRLAVGAVVVTDARILLIQRGKAPKKGFWSVPGGGVELGELLKDAVAREALEETGLQVTPGPLLCMYERVEKTAAGKVLHHHVVADFLCSVVGGELRAGSDAEDVCYFTFKQALKLQTTEGLLPVITRALVISARASTEREGSSASAASRPRTSRQRRS